MAGLDIASAGWSARWQGVRPEATYNHSFGLETWWRANWVSAGYPLTDQEQTFSFEGQDYAGRVFERAGVVIWKPEGAFVVGWR